MPRNYVKSHIWIFSLETKGTLVFNFMHYLLQRKRLQKEDYATQHIHKLLILKTGMGIEYRFFFINLSKSYGFSYWYFFKPINVQNRSRFTTADT